MARARNIKPGFFKNYELADLGPHIQLLFAGLWCLADREGRLEMKPRLIKAEIFPYYEVDVNAGLTQLARCGFVKFFKSKGCDCLEIINFKKHQSPHNTEKTSQLNPDIPLESDAYTINESVTVDSRKYNGGNPPDSLIPDTGFTDSLIPDFPNPNSLIPENSCEDVASDEPRTALTVAKKPKPTSEQTEANKATWESYAGAYERRYGAKPIRNAQTNGIIAKFVKSVDMAEAPLIARYYINLNTDFYVKQLHPVSLLLKDANAIRTQWATNRQVTSASARNLDKQQATLSGIDEYLREKYGNDYQNVVSEQ